MRVLARFRARRGDEGFGLVEMIVALLIAGLVFGALATTLVAALKSSLFGRQNQQAADFMTQALEDARLLDYGSLSVPADALATAPHAQVVAGVTSIEVSPGVWEPVVTADVPGLELKSTIDDQNTNNTVYTLYRYVTEPVVGDAEQVKRVTVFVRWTWNGTERERSTSTLIAYSQRGLPNPFYELSPLAVSQTVNPGPSIVYTFELSNKGAPGRWDLSLGGTTTGFSLFADSNNDGVWSSGDVALTDTSGNGVVDTGLVDPGSTFRFFLVHPDTAPAYAVGSYTTTVTASPVQPGAETQTKTAIATTTVQTGAITPTPPPVTPTATPTVSPSTPPEDPMEAACTMPTVPDASTNGSHNLITYALHNDATADTPTLQQLEMSGISVSWGSPGKYSTDRSPLPGRLLSPSTAGNESAVLALSDESLYADWEIQYPTAKSARGRTVASLWVASTNGSAPAGTLRVLLYTTNASGAVQNKYFQTVPVPVSTCTGYQQVAFELPIGSGNSTITIPANGKLHLRVASTGTSDLRLGYDAVTTPAYLTVGLK